jgi:hypothetical protein
MAQVTMTGPYLGIVLCVSSSLKVRHLFSIIQKTQTKESEKKIWDVKAPTYSLLVLFERLRKHKNVQLGKI